MRQWLGGIALVGLLAVGCAQGGPSVENAGGTEPTPGEQGTDTVPEDGSDEARELVEERANLPLPADAEVKVVRAESDTHVVARFELAAEAAEALCEPLGGALVYRELTEEDRGWSGLTQADLGEFARRCSGSDPAHVLRQRTVIVVPGDDGRATVHLQAFEMPD